MPANLPADARTIDLGDLTLLPGLIDAHTHLTFDISGDWVTRSVTELPADAALRGALNARKTLLAGFTTVRDVGADRLRRRLADEGDRCRNGGRSPDDSLGPRDRHHRRTLRRHRLGARA